MKRFFEGKGSTLERALEHLQKAVVKEYTLSQLLSIEYIVYIKKNEVKMRGEMCNEFNRAFSSALELACISEKKYHAGEYHAETVVMGLFEVDEASKKQREQMEKDNEDDVRESVQTEEEAEEVSEVASEYSHSAGISPVVRDKDREYQKEDRGSYYRDVWKTYI